MILVFGKTGQVAQELARAMPEATFLGRSDVDLTASGACADAIRQTQPTAVINAAAYTAVDRAEEEEPLARAVNAAAPGAMALVCAEIGSPLVHISTDYVFDGSGESPFSPDDPTGPLGAYGRTKREGEIAVAEAGGPHAVLRTSWVFSAHGSNFLKTMLRLSETRDRLTVVGDQVGGPTPAREIAVTCLRIAEVLRKAPEKSGIYHYSGAPDVSWADFARAILAEAGRNTVVEDIPTEAWPTPAVRPANSRLECRATRATFGIERPDWRGAVGNILEELSIK